MLSLNITFISLKDKKISVQLNSKTILKLSDDPVDFLDTRHYWLSIDEYLIILQGQNLFIYFT